MRAVGLSPNDLTDAIASDGGWISRDDRGNIVVVDFVITVYGERGRQR